MDDKAKMMAVVAALDRSWAHLREYLEDIERIARGGQIAGDERDALIIRAMAHTVAGDLHMKAAEIEAP